MLTFLFWNIGMNRKEVQQDSEFQTRLLESAARLVKLWQVDILILAEYTIDPQHMVSVMNADQPDLFTHSRSLEPKLAIFGKTATVTLTTGREGLRYTTRHVTLTRGEPLLLVAVHMPSKADYSDDGQATEAMHINMDIVSEEEHVGHRRTLVVGDFNMNPFENGMISAGHFHGMMTRALVQRQRRKVAGRYYYFFFNPMWSFFGDDPATPTGTYYRWMSEPKCYMWNLFDQVLLRPALLGFFPRDRQKDNLRILTTDGTIQYLKESGIPDQELASDHLPVMIRLEL